MKIVIAAAQFAPEVLSLKGSVEKACSLIQEAGKNGVRLLAFPETWIPVYPIWVDMGTFSKWGDPRSKKLFARMYNNSLRLDSDEMRRICKACRDAKLFTVLGINETESSSKSIYNTLVSISDKGEVLKAHRKLVPTFGERLIWGQGDGCGLVVSHTEFGSVGGLICWEHWMPPARQVLHEQGETIHVAAWPHGKERHQLASRHYAFEGRCFVLAAAMYLEKSMFPVDFELREELALQPDILLPGGSAIIAPDASYIVGPVFDKEEMIFAEIDTSLPIAESLTLDVAGHYSRPDVFQLSVTTPKKINRPPSQEFP